MMTFRPAVSNRNKHCRNFKIAKTQIKFKILFRRYEMTEYDHRPKYCSNILTYYSKRNDEYVAICFNDLSNMAADTYAVRPQPNLSPKRNQNSLSVVTSSHEFRNLFLESAYPFYKINQ